MLESTIVRYNYKLDKLEREKLQEAKLGQFKMLFHALLNTRFCILAKMLSNRQILEYLLQEKHHLFCCAQIYAKVQCDKHLEIWNWKCVISKSNIWQGRLRRRNWILGDKRVWSHKDHTKREKNFILESSRFWPFSWHVDSKPIIKRSVKNQSTSNGGFNLPFIILKF